MQRSDALRCAERISVTHNKAPNALFAQGFMPLHVGSSRAFFMTPCQQADAFASRVPVLNDYATSLAQIYARAPQPASEGLARMQALLAALGNPHRHVPSVVVAGTNGKGSTCHLISEALRLAGARVGLFTSPHLLSYTERIRVDGRLIAPKAVVDGVAHILTVAGAHALTPTFFEVTTALALRFFAQQKVDIAVLEVGVGGRLDATNVACKILTVLTPISYDHEALLGDTLAGIAAEKAAILAAHVPAVIAPQAPEAAQVIDARLEVCHIDAHYAGLGEADFAGVIPPYQRINFACAQAACQVLDAKGPVRCPPAAFAQAAANFSWPGRYQWLMPKEAGVVALPCPVILDGGHNPAGARALQAAIAADPKMTHRPLHIIFALVQGKDADAVLAALRPWAASWRVCGLKSKRRRDAADMARDIGDGAQSYNDFEAAWKDVLAHPPPPDARIVVCGSLFLVADALAHLTQAERDPPIDG